MQYSLSFRAFKDCIHPNVSYTSLSYNFLSQHMLYSAKYYETFSGGNAAREYQSTVRGLSGHIEDPSVVIGSVGQPS